jgi:acyl carrier protein
MSPDDRARTSEPAPASTAATLQNVIADMLRELRPGAPQRPVSLDDRIEQDLGLDSLSRVELAARVEHAFGVRLPEHVAIAARTPRDLLDAIAKAPREPGAPALARTPVPPPPVIAGTPEGAATIVDAFRWHLERHPEREHITLIDGDTTLETLSYAQLWAAAAEVGRGMRASGIARGDAVALMLPTCSGFFQAFLGAMRIGAVPVPMYPPLRWSEIEEHVRGRAAILANARARMLLTVPEAMFVGQLARATLPELRSIVTVEELRSGGEDGDVAPVTSRDTAMLQYTSGSTGDPKGVVLSHDNLLANIHVMGPAAAATSSDRFVSWLPLYHDMGLIGAWLATLYYAVPLVVMPPTSFLARPARWLWAIHRYRGTISAGPNFAYEIAASKIRDEDLEGLDLRCWRLAFNGAEPVRAATLERFASRFARYGFDRRALMPVYGLAETAVGLTFPPLGRGPLIERIDSGVLARDGRAEPAAEGAEAALEVVSCGLPLPGHEIRVVDDAGREVPARSEGRIEFRGPSATAGYHRNPAATGRLFRGDWLDTGDVGYIAGGELFLTSRAKDLIKRGGHNIHPYDLEAAVGDIPGIRKGCVAVFGTADRAAGTERVIVVAETNRTDEASRAALRDRIMTLAGVHLNGPADEVLLVPARTVLKTSSGKIRRAACRELYETGLLTAPRPAVWLQVASLAARAVGAGLRRGAQTIAQAAYGVYAWLVVIVLTIVGVPLVLLLPGRRVRFRFSQRLAKALVRSCAIPLDVNGLEHLPVGKPAVIVVNHASYVDALVVLAALEGDVRFAAKREFVRSRLFGLVLRRVGTYFVERVDPTGGVEDTRELASAVGRGETIVFFPEGTFSRVPGLAAFRLGAFVVSASTGVPIVPVVLRGTRSVLRADRWLATRYPVTVSVQPPIVPDGSDWSAAVRLRDAVRHVMLRHCGEPDVAR